MTLLGDTTPPTPTTIAQATLGAVGVDVSGLRPEGAAHTAEIAAQLGRAGYRTLWQASVGLPGALRSAETLLEAVGTIAVAALVEVGLEDPTGIARQAAALGAQHPDRFLVAIGAGRRWLATEPSRRGLQQIRSLDQLRAQLAALDAHPAQTGAERRLLAVSDEHVLQLAKEHAAGALLHFTAPEHTRLARQALGPGKLLAVTQLVVYEEDPPSARGRARRFLAPQLAAPSNITESLRHFAGAQEEDLAGGGSDRLVDQLVAWGDESAIRERVSEQFQAGADHVLLRVAGASREPGMDALMRLATPLCASAARQGEEASPSASPQSGASAARA